MTVVVVEGILDPKDRVYKFFHFPKQDPKPITLIARIDDQGRIWHETQTFEFMKYEIHGQV